MWEWPHVRTAQCTQLCFPGSWWAKRDALLCRFMCLCAFAYMQIYCIANVQRHREKWEVCTVCKRAPGNARGNGHTHVQTQPGGPMHICELHNARGSTHRNATTREEHAQANAAMHGTRMCKHTCRSANAHGAGANTPTATRQNASLLHPCAGPDCTPGIPLLSLKSAKIRSGHEAVPKFQVLAPPGEQCRSFLFILLI